MIMRKSYAYVMAFLLLLFLMWAGYYIYTANDSKEYEYGTFVELPKEDNVEMEYLV